ncbi:MAG TPA: DUF4625 domain-containing protein [Chitinophagaceae bacterium]|nr:DUF4625 domain-containing protein [Chitinophagaceae bacterium]
MKRSFAPYVLLFLLACSKDPVNDKDYTAPVLTLNTPTNNQVFTAGQSIMVSGQVTDNKFISQIHIVITNLGSGFEYQHVHIMPNASSFTFNQSYTAQAGIFYKIEVIADDGSANSSAKSVQVFTN